MSPTDQDGATTPPLPKAPFDMTVCGIEELAGHVALGATHVLSILDPDRPVPEAFGTYGEHEKLELRFHDVVEETPGMVAPTPEHVAAVLALGRDMMADTAERPVLLVHCHMGISRSTASMALILAQAMPDTDAATILAMVHDIREKAWPNLRMIEFGDAQLGRGGALAAATTALHRKQLDRRPDIATYHADAGRGRELEAALRL